MKQRGPDTDLRAPGGGRLPLLVPVIGGLGAIGSQYARSRMNRGAPGIRGSQTYGFDGVRNVAFDGTPRIAVLGEQRIAPAYVSFFTRQSGADQYLYALLYAGQGGDYGIESLTDFYLNDQPASAFEEVEITTRLGTSGQTAISGFESDTSLVLKNLELNTDNTHSYTHRTTKDVDSIAFVMAWYSGLYGQNTKNGETVIESRSQYFEVRYKLSTASTWTQLKPEKGSGWFYKQSSYLWRTGGCSQSIVRRVMIIPLPATGTYDVEITRNNTKSQAKERKATIVRVEESVDTDNAHAGDALVAIKFLAQEGLSGALPKLTCLCRGWKVKNQGDSSAAWTRNPSKLVEAVLSDSSVGFGDWIPSALLDNGAGGTFRTVAARCDADAAASGDHAEDHWQLDYVLDSEASASEHLGAMLSSFRASLVEWDGKIRLVQDVASSSVATFDGRQARSASNRPILAFDNGLLDISETEIPSDDESRPTHIKVQYVDRNEDYARRMTDEIVSPDWSSGLPLARREVFLAGVSRETQAIREARFIMNRGRLRTIMAEIGVGIGDIDMVPGDVVTLYTDYPTWAGKLFQVIGISYDSLGRGRLRLLEYDANAYTDTSDTLPARPGWVSRQDALKKASQIPRGASNLQLREVT